MTLLNHGNDEVQVTENLDEFLRENAKPFSAW